MTKFLIVGFVLAATLSACATPSTEEQVEARIVRACVATGLFRAVAGPVLSAVPQTALPARLLGAGIDIACAHPEIIAHDAAAISAVIRALDEIARERATSRLMSSRLPDGSR